MLAARREASKSYYELLNNVKDGLLTGEFARTQIAEENAEAELKKM